MSTDDTQPDISQVEKTPVLTPATATTPKFSRKSHKVAYKNVSPYPSPTPTSPIPGAKKQKSNEELVATTPTDKKRSQKEQQKSNQNTLRRRPVTTPKESIRTAAPTTPGTAQKKGDTKTTQSSEDNKFLEDDAVNALSPLLPDKTVFRNDCSEDFGPRGAANFIKYREAQTVIRTLRKQPWMVYVDQVVKFTCLLFFMYTYYIYHYVYHSFELKLTPEFHRLAKGFENRGVDFSRCNHENWSQISNETMQGYNLNACDTIDKYASLVRVFKVPPSVKYGNHCIDRYEVYPCMDKFDARMDNVYLNVPKIDKFPDCFGTTQNPRMYSLETHPYKVEQLDLEKLTNWIVPASYFYSRCPICGIATRLLRDKNNPDICFHKIQEIRPASPRYLAKCLPKIHAPCNISKSSFLTNWGTSLAEQVLPRYVVFDPKEIITDPSED